MSRRIRPDWLCVSLLILAVGCASTDVPRFSTQPAPVAEKPFPYQIVQLSGSSADLGRQQGEQLSPAIHTLHDKYLLVYLQSQTQRFFALSAARLFETQLLPAHQAELAALAQSTQIDEQETMLGQCFLDLSAMSACSTITLPASASLDHVARFGRNLDFASLDVADKYTTVFIYHPNDGRYAFASIGWPGMMGVLSGMNEYGLCLANMEVTRSPRLPQAMPYTMLYRTVLEQCKTVDEAVTFLKKTRIQTANNLMLMDATGCRAVAELTPDSVHVRYGLPDAPLISTNHQRDQDQDTPGRCWRYDYLHQTATDEFGQLGQPAVEDLLAHVGSHATLQSMIFEPANRVMYLSAGKDAAHGEFSRLDLRPLFK
jgi:isopenicillin-N N-acyltransferase like protein